MVGMEVEELLMQRGDWDQAKGQQIAQDALTQFGEDVEVIFCNNDAMALGALQAIQASGRKVNEDIYLVGVDALTDAVQNIVDGNFTGTVFNDSLQPGTGCSSSGSEFPERRRSRAGKHGRLRKSYCRQRSRNS